MLNDVEIIIPEHFRFMAEYAGPMALKLSQRLHGKPYCLTKTTHGINCPSFISVKISEMKKMFLMFKTPLTP